MSWIATHSGPFHADDVLAVALLRRFRSSEAAWMRTRDLSRIAPCDLVVDVGGVYDPASGRFDHHQASYTGPLSSAGMVLAHLIAEGLVSPGLGAFLAAQCVDYVDAVDNGRVTPRAGVPCFPRIIEAINALATTEEEFDAAFAQAVALASLFLGGLVAEHQRVEDASSAVVSAMGVAAAAGSNVLAFDVYINWKPAYFAHGGASHPTEFVVFPGTDGTWRVIAIPPREGEFGQKVSLPASWAGKTDAELEAVTGVPGSMFCHKNRFIAVFRTREGAISALSDAGLLRPSLAPS